MADAGRVIAGSARGIRLEAPGPTTRPLGDRVKQTLFAILEPDLRGARVLDLFAGSGAAGIEALSRGAGHVTFVERDAGAARIIAANLERTSLGGARARVVRAEAIAWLRRPGDLDSSAPFGLVIVDPPYVEAGLLAVALEALAPHLAPHARVVAKHFWRDRPPARVGLLASERERRFGETTLTFYRRQEDR
jgi:16S rRNA (guanine966-N2)-methyltransferase